MDLGEMVPGREDGGLLRPGQEGEFEGYAAGGGGEVQGLM